MATLPELTETDIRNWTDARTFERGKGYQRDGFILHPRRQGTTLKTQCLGSQPTPYRVQVTLNEKGIANATCSCPVGYACKHTVALLLAWIHEPDTFSEQETLEASLAKRSHGELIALIKKMLDRVPELEDLLQIQTLGALPSTQQIPPDAICRQVEQAMSSGRGEWGESYEIVHTLNEIIGTGAGYAARNDWHNAAVVYATAGQTILDNYESVYDDEGEVLEPVGECVRGLGECLENIQDEGVREGIFHALLGMFQWDVDQGGYGAADEIPIVFDDQASPEEKQMLAGWVRELLETVGSARDEIHRNWRREHYGALLLDLEADTLDDEAYLQVCRETGCTSDLVDRLLALQRTEEALEAAHGLDDMNLLGLVNLFTTYQQEALFRELLLKRVAKDQTGRIKAWLKEYAQRNGNLAEALVLAEEMFWGRPSLQGYQELQKLALPLQQWDALRAKTLERMIQDARFGVLLVEVYLADHEVGQAIQALKKTEKSPTVMWGGYNYAYGAPLKIRVAQAAEKDFPTEAIDLYTRAAFALIDARGRDNYAAAAQHLLRVRELYKRVGDPGRFTSLMQNLRDSNKSLRALKEELTKVGL